MECRAEERADTGIATTTLTRKCRRAAGAAGAAVDKSPLRRITIPRPHADPQDLSG